MGDQAAVGTTAACLPRADEATWGRRRDGQQFGCPLSPPEEPGWTLCLMQVFAAKFAEMFSVILTEHQRIKCQSFYGKLNRTNNYQPDRRVPLSRPLVQLRLSFEAVNPGHDKDSQCRLPKIGFLLHCNSRYSKTEKSVIAGDLYGTIKWCSFTIISVSCRPPITNTARWISFR
ncbi:hypothetical protein J6590_076539 [Homalodisca vitripennis]|nr:hypothetical protein J6590_076539 [Homalodisca vitripennis]